MRVLVILPSLPFPPDDGGKLRSAHLVRHLAAEHDVALVCFGSGEQRPQHNREHAGAGLQRLDVVPLPVPASRVTTLLSPAPSEVETFKSEAMADLVATLVAEFSPDVVLAGDPALTQYVTPYGGRIRVLDYACEFTLQFRRLQTISRGSQRVLWLLRRLKMVRYMRHAADHYDLCVVNSDQDRQALLASSPGWRKVAVVPNGLDLAGYPLNMAAPEPNTLVFPGAVSYPPNRDAVAYYVDAIHPRVRAQVPEARLLITGAVPEGTAAPRVAGVEYTGYVPDVRRPIAEAWACLVPMRAGCGGPRLKVLEALALGTPVVSTSIGAEGLDGTPGRDILIADDPAGFAADTVAVLRSRDLRNRLAAAGRQLVVEQYNWEVLGARFADLVAAEVDHAGRSGTPTYAELGRTAAVRE